MQKIYHIEHIGMVSHQYVLQYVFSDEHFVQKTHHIEHIDMFFHQYVSLYAF